MRHIIGQLIRRRIISAVRLNAEYILKFTDGKDNPSVRKEPFDHNFIDKTENSRSIGLLPYCFRGFYQKRITHR